MKKLFAAMLIPFFVTPLSVISTEKTIPLTNAEKYQLTSTVVSATDYFETLPTHPVLLTEATVYKDANLTQPAGQKSADTVLPLESLLINDQTLPVFALSDDTYIEASCQLIRDDIVLSQEPLSEDEWLTAEIKAYESPYVAGTKSVKTSLKPYTKVQLTQKATTAHGVYYQVAEKIWVDEQSLSATDNRMERVQDLLNQKYNKSNYSIYVKQLDTGATAGINADKVMYSASVAKLATLYDAQAQLQAGTIKLTDKIKYTKDSISFAKAYDVSGSGEMPKTPDNKDYTVESLLKLVAQKSDNVATNILGYYVSHQYDDAFQTKIDTLAGTSVDMKARNLSAQTAGNLMEAIYYQNGDIITYLSTTDFDKQRISKNIAVPVAHKIGDAYDYKHDVAIVYADQPFILSIFTDKASYDDITQIADDVYAILK